MAPVASDHTWVGARSTMRASLSSGCRGMVSVVVPFGEVVGAVVIL